MEHIDIIIDILETLVHKREAVNTTDAMQKYGLNADMANEVLQFLINQGAVIESSDLVNKVVLYDLKTTKDYLDSLR